MRCTFVEQNDPRSNMRLFQDGEGRYMYAMPTTRITEQADRVRSVCPHTSHLRRPANIGYDHWCQICGLDLPDDDR